MGDVKPPCGGPGDSSVLLLIHDSGSSFSEALEICRERLTISMQKPKSVEG